MNAFDYIIAILLGVAGIWLTYVVARTMLRAIPWKRPQIAPRASAPQGSAPPKKPAAPDSSARKYGKILSQTDAAIQDNDWDKAIKILAKAVAASPAPASREAAEQLRDYQQNILSRCLILSEHANARIENIATVERLIVERGDLLILSIKSKDTYGRVHSKRAQKGKNIPAWSKNEFKQKTADVKRQLKENDAELKKEWKSLFSSLREQLKKGSVTYH